MDLRHLNKVEIENVNFSYNTIPTIDDVIDKAIVTIKFCSKITITGCTFENNMAMYGALYIEYYRELWEVDTSSSPYNLLSIHEEVITIDACEFKGNTAFTST